MIKSAWIFSFIVISFTCGLAIAEEKTPSEFDVCINKAKSETKERRCLLKEKERLDTILRGYYGKALTHLEDDEGRKTKLIQAQRAWEEFVNVDCEINNRQSKNKFKLKSLCQIQNIKKRIAIFDFRISSEFGSDE